jgi:hypothetical protein
MLRRRKDEGFGGAKRRREGGEMRKGAIMEERNLNAEKIEEARFFFFIGEGEEGIWSLDWRRKGIARDLQKMRKESRLMEEDGGRFKGGIRLREAHGR